MRPKEFKAKGTQKHVMGRKANDNPLIFARVGDDAGTVATGRANFYWICLLDDDSRLTQCYSLVPLANNDLIFVRKAKDRKLTYYEFAEFIQNTGSGSTTPPTAIHDLLSATHDDTTPAAVILGDLIYGGAGPAWTRLGIGGAGTVLTVAGGVPTWAAPGVGAHNILSATHTDSAAAACVVGDVITGQAGPAWTRLAVGTQGHFFKADAGTTPSWVRISTQTVTVGPGTTCEYATLGACIADFGVGLPNPTAANPWVVLVFGGVYAEVGNITVPSYCWIVGMGEGTQINMGTNQDITFSANSGMESCYVYGDPTSYLLGATGDGVVWRDVRAYLTALSTNICFRANASGGLVKAYHCEARSATNRLGTGFHAMNGEFYLYDCDAEGLGYGLYVLDTATTFYCNFTDCNYDISNHGIWNHTMCRSLRTNVVPGTDYSGHTHWPNGEYFDLDFTGTDWDGKAECNYVGMRFSDTATPFPSTLRYPISGTWAHVAGVGWRPTAGVADEGPAILIPLCRAANWKIKMVVNYNPGNEEDRIYIYFGYITNSNHVGATGAIQDTGAANSLTASLHTNNGADAFVQQWAGAALVGAASRTYEFRCLHGCVSVWDDQDNAWHDYTGRQSAGLAYTAAYAFLQWRKDDGHNQAQCDLESLELTYLL